MKRIITAGLVLIGALFIGIVSILRGISTKAIQLSRLEEDIFQEFVKFFIQFVFIALAGGILVQEYNRSRQRKIDLKAFRKEIYKSLVDVYLKTKRIRWILRANDKNQEINFKIYTDEMAKIIDAKTQLEIIIHEIKAYSKPFRSIEKELENNLMHMEDFLRDLLQEYHHKSLNPINGAKTISTAHLPYYRQFIITVPDDQKTTDYQSEFTAKYRKPFYAALLLLKDNEIKMIDLVSQRFFNW